MASGDQGEVGSWLTPALPPHSSPAKEVASPASLVNGVQPSKHENGFSDTEGSKELLELSHHSSSPGSIIPFGDKEPFLKQAVVKPPQVTGERREGASWGWGCAVATPISTPSLCLQRCCKGWALGCVPAGPHVQTRVQSRSCCQKKHLAPAPAMLRGALALQDPSEALREPDEALRDAWFLSLFFFQFCFVF